MTTISPNFIFNSGTLPPPGTHKWIEPKEKGVNGESMQLLLPFYEYEIKWTKLTQNEFKSILTLWRGHYGSGGANIYLPQYDGDQYQFTYYTGVQVDKPKMNGEYDENYVSDITMRIRRISIE